MGQGSCICCKCGWYGLCHSESLRPKRLYTHVNGLFYLFSVQLLPANVLNDFSFVYIVTLFLTLRAITISFRDVRQAGIYLTFTNVCAAIGLFGFSDIDTGIGIEKSIISKLFESFTRVDLSTTRKFGGAGLGLAICKTLIELMGETIEVESLKGEGSVFRFDIVVKRRIDDGQQTLNSKPATPILSCRNLIWHR